MSHSVAISHMRLPATHPFREDVRSLQCRSGLGSDSLLLDFLVWSGQSIFSREGDYNADNQYFGSKVAAFRAD